MTIVDVIISNTMSLSMLISKIIQLISTNRTLFSIHRFYHFSHIASCPNLMPCSDRQRNANAIERNFWPTTWPCVHCSAMEDG